MKYFPMGVMVPVLVTLILSAWSTAHAAECRSQKSDDGHWAWRTIEGQKCWYQGRAGLDKTKLHWPRQDSRPVNLEGCCWPPLGKE